MSTTHSPTAALRCSFCGKGAAVVPMTQRGGGSPRVCTECLDLCDDILVEELGE